MECQKKGIDIERDRNNIIINKMNHPVNVSNFLRAIYHGRRQGFKEFKLNFTRVNSAFPNVCVPISGIVLFFKQIGIDFIYDGMPDYLIRSNIENPLIVGSNIAQISRSSLDIVWKFHDSNEVNLLVDAFIDEVSRTVECRKGVLEGLTWCLNEVIDNVIQHSGVDMGFVMGQIHKNSKHLAFCIFDSGRGIYNSLKNTVHAPRYPADAITLAVKEGVTRDSSIGQGNGLWGLHEIIKLNSGRLVITSSSASYMMLGDQIQIYDRIPHISKENGCVTIDFQIDFDKEIPVSQALKGHEPINLRIENLENEQGILVYKLSEKSSGTGTRQSGESIRNEIINLHNESGRFIEIDFEGIAVISSSFADELIGRLLVRYGFYYFNQVFRLKNMNQIIQSIVHRSVSQRMAESLKIN